MTGSDNMTLRTGYQQLLACAEREICTLSPAEAVALLGAEDVQFIDLRDVRELQREGQIPGAFHAPRGMLEFWVDPESPYFKPIFGAGKRLIFYCQSGWRSALATHTVQQMGLPQVAHIGGGFRAWGDAGNPIETDPAAK